VDLCSSAGAIACLDGRYRICESADNLFDWGDWQNCPDGIRAGADACGICSNTCADDSLTSCDQGTWTRWSARHDRPCSACHTRST
jgi:hypothetical protein